MHSPGIEPGSYAWEAYILPLNHGCLFILFFSFPFFVVSKRRAFLSFFFSFIFFSFFHSFVVLQ